MGESSTTTRWAQANKHMKQRPDLQTHKSIPGDLHAPETFSKSSLKRQVRRIDEQ